MKLDFRAINTVAGIGLNCATLIVVLGVLVKTESERLVWIAFMRAQWVMLYVWLVLPFIALFATRDSDVRRLFFTSFAISALFTWLAEITYDRDIVTVLASEVGQSVLRFAAGKFFAPIDLEAISKAGEMPGEVEDADDDDGLDDEDDEQRKSHGKEKKQKVD